jgi:hypothetical protein
MPKNTDTRIPLTLDLEKLALNFERAPDMTAYEERKRDNRARRNGLYAANREKRLEQIKRYRDSEKGQATAKAYRERKREERNAYQREWRKRQGEEYREKQRLRMQNYRKRRCDVATENNPAGASPRV